MSHIVLEVMALDRVVTEPEFTSVGLLLPESYYTVYANFHNAICDELNRLKFDQVMNQSLAQGIAPMGGFTDWIGESTLAIWVLTLKTGNHPQVFWPKNVAKHIVLVTKDMFAEMLLKRSAGEDSPVTH